MWDLDVSTTTRIGDAPFFVFADHASNIIPPDLNCLGMPEDVLETHIAWDIGAGALADAIGRILDGTVFRCNFSRLVIDVNRDLSTKDLIPASSDQIPIPGNQMLSETERQARIDHFFKPYHENLSAAVDEIMTRANAPFIISVHSFTKRMMGATADRPWHVGLLWREDQKSAHAVMNTLAHNSGWTVGDNEPYDARVFNYSIDRHVGPRSLSHVTFEARQDILQNPSSIEEAAITLAEAIKDAAGRV